MQQTISQPAYSVCIAYLINRYQGTDSLTSLQEKEMVFNVNLRILHEIANTLESLLKHYYCSKFILFVFSALFLS